MVRRINNGKQKDNLLDEIKNIIGFTTQYEWSCLKHSVHHTLLPAFQNPAIITHLEKLQFQM